MFHPEALADPDPHVRLLALATAGPADRPQVLRAALLDGHRWQDAQADGVRLADTLLAWLTGPAATAQIGWWLAEDSRHGHHGVRVLATQRGPIEAALRRTPAWLNPERAAAAACWTVLLSGWKDAPRRHALALRLGTTGTPSEPLQDALAEAGALPSALGRLASWAGRSFPTRGAWIPEPADLRRCARGRRWPVRADGDVLLACTLCGEGLPPDGPCTWCGADPDQEPPTEIPVEQWFTPREPCPTCGIDLHVAAAPTRCPCCEARR